MKKLSLNIKKIALSLLVVGLAVGFSAFTNSDKASGLAANYYYNGSPEAWTSPGAIAADQTATNYTQILPSTVYDCAEEISVVCTYDFVGGKFVLNSRGENSLQ